MRFALTRCALAASLSVLAMQAGATALTYGQTIDVPVNQSLALPPNADASERAVQAVAERVALLMAAMAAKDVDAMAPLYVNSPDAMYFSGGENWKTRGTERFLRTQVACLGAVGEMEVLPYDMQMQFLDDVMITTLTGQNHLPLGGDRIARTSWRWSLVFRRSGDSDWLIAHEHFSFKEE
ncbi:YybH family protein [Tropicibacter sp. S64]|uniref:YybH family protein n=1 Tax=Tropicibacter sp. S64 TaxID=3415122 RepID=UPI003C7CB645